MAKKGKIERNERKAKLIQQYAAKRAELKAKMYDYDLSDDERLEAQKRFAKLPTDANPIRYRNRCGVTGRPRGFYRKFKMSRIALREYANTGLLPGVTKSSF